MLTLKIYEFTSWEIAAAATVHYERKFTPIKTVN